MELRTLLFLLCVPAFISGSPSKQTKHGFNSNLHGNMKQYFKNYMAGNFIGAHEKKFDTKKVSTWSGEDISKREVQLFAETSGSKSEDTLSKFNADLNLVPAVGNVVQKGFEEIPTQASLVGKRENALKQDFSRFSLAEANNALANADLSLAQVAEKVQQGPANLVKYEEISTQASLVGKRENAQQQDFSRFSLAEAYNALANADLSLAQVAEKVQQGPANLVRYEEISTQASLVGKRENALKQDFSRFSLAEANNALANADLSLAQVAEKVQQGPANLVKYEEISTQASLIVKRENALQQDFSRFSLAEANNALANADLSLAQVAEKVQQGPANLVKYEEISTQASLVGKREKALQQEFSKLASELSLAQVAETLPTAEPSFPKVVGKRGKANEERLDTLTWLREASNIRQKLDDDIDSFFKSWKDILNILPGSCGEPPKAPVSTHESDLALLGITPVFMNLFWPFRFDVNVMNQRLAAYDLTQKIITGNETLKQLFFEELQDLQGIHLPVKAKEIMFSFGDEDVVDGMIRSRLLTHSKSYLEAGKHLFTKDEQEKIRLLANRALDVINQTHPELYSAMVQMISCITFFKNEDGMYRGGSITSAIGLIWLDPRQDWTVPLMVEQIVHEFIHNSVYYAEFVHGAYRDVSRLPEAKVMSAIRHEPRNYDKSLHAAYVSAGLITFHTRVGFIDRAAELAKTLPGAVQDLNRVNAETDVLDESGRAMLDFLTDFVCLTRI